VPELFDVAGGDEAADRDQAEVSAGQLEAGPHLPQEHVVGEGYKVGAKLPIIFCMGVCSASVIAGSSF
jgi:hypothetical protein